jgi:hypothetical protein
MIVAIASVKNRARDCELKVQIRRQHRVTDKRMELSIEQGSVKAQFYFGL